MRIQIAAGLTAVGLMAACSPAMAETHYGVMYEPRQEAGIGSLLYVATYDNLDAVLNSAFPGSASGYTHTSVNSDYHVVGFTHDDSAFRVMYETRADAGAATELYVASYATLDDLFNSSFAGSPSGFTQINVNSDYSVVGFAQDSGGYRVMYETRTDADASTELYIASYATLDDLFNSSFAGAPSGFTQINVNSDYSVVGFTHDGGGYRLMYETRADAGAATELYLATYATLDDLFNSSFSGSPSGFTQIDVNPDYSVVGIAAFETFDGRPDGTGGPGPGGGGGGGVPEPATWSLLILGFGAAGAALRARSRRFIAA